ncbi:hypothetical protein D3C76_1627990 [compost metagenome]
MRNMRLHGKCLGYQRTQRIGFFLAAHTDNAATRQTHRGHRGHFGQQCLIGIDDPATFNHRISGMDYTPLDEAVTAVELKNHHATSN